MGGLRLEVLPMGEAALLLETDDIDAVLTLDRALRARADAGGGVWDEVDDIVPAARTVLLVARPGTDLARLGAQARKVAAGVSGAAYRQENGEVEIKVRYDGPDLEEVARLTGLGVEEVVAAHTGTPWRVGFGGFAPGFAYLLGGDPRLEVPRRESPRTSVPPGSVGLAGEFSGIYPRSSPGGWQLIGSTDAALWDVDRDPPALLTPGMTVRFRSFSPGAGNSHCAGEPLPCSVNVSRPRRDGARGLEVLEAGVRTLVQDAGRVGHMAVGVGRAGAADVAAYGLGARLLGNPGGAAALEITLGGLSVRARGDLTVCLTGAPAPATVAGRPVGHAAPLTLDDGAVLTLGTPAAGLLTYLSVRGGIDLDPVLGSRATDTMSGLGPPPVERGQVLEVGPEPHDLPLVDQAAVPRPVTDPLVLRVTSGPRLAWFADPDRLTSSEWTVSDRSDRRGIRLEGDALERVAHRREDEVPSEGMVRGAIQVPPSGEPVVLLNDHPVTGGYPVIAVVRAADLDHAVQAAPGQRLRFGWAGA